MKAVEFILKNGGVGVMPTDTIYGIVGPALDKKAVLRIYRLKKRNPAKPVIILIDTISQLKKFGVRPDKKTGALLRKLWPGAVSVILPCKQKKFSYLHRGTKTLAFRLPAKKSLRMLLKKTGPLIAPSANWEGEPPAKNIKEAKQYFGRKLDFYKSGKTNKKPSTLIAFKDGKLSVLRSGAVNVQKRLFNV